jgi:hypothetical protein
MNNEGPKVKIFLPDGSEEILGGEAEKKPETPKIKVLWTEGAVVLEEKKKDVDPGSGDKLFPQDIEALIKRQGEIYRKRNVLCNQHVELSEDAPISERKPLVKQILGLSDEYNTLAAQKRAWEKTGVIPKIEKKEPSSDKLELYKKKVNLGKNLSKARKNLERYQMQPEKVIKYKNQIAKLEAEIQELESLYSKS